MNGDDVNANTQFTQEDVILLCYGYKGYFSTILGELKSLCLKRVYHFANKVYG